MNSLELWSESLVSSLMSIVDQIFSFLPQLLAGLFILFIGYFCARVVRKSIFFLINKLNLNTYSEKVFGGTGLTNLNAKFDLAKLISGAGFYLTFFVFLLSAAEALKLSGLSAGINSILGYVPNVFAATIMLGLSFYLANMARSFFEKSISRFMPSISGVISIALFSLIVTIGVVLALGQLQLETALLTNIVQMLLVSICVVTVLAFGLGCMPLAKSLVSGIYLKNTFKNTNYVSVLGEVGRVIAVGPLFTHISKPDGTDIFLPNELIVNQKINTYNNIKLSGNTSIDDNMFGVNQSKVTI